MKRLICLVATMILVAAAAPLAVAGDDVGVWKETRGEVSFMTGGVGMEEREELEASAGAYNLKIVTAKVSGAYLTGLPVAIYDETGGQILRVETKGPWLYVRLPEGSYRVEAQYEGERKEKTVRATSKMESTAFHWKD